MDDPILTFSSTFGDTSQIKEQDATDLFDENQDDTSFIPSSDNFTNFDLIDEDYQRVMHSTEEAQQDAFLNSLASDESWASVASFGPRCNRCGNPCGNDVIFCENLAYHKRHFTCKKCKSRLSEAIPISGEIYCKNCAPTVKPSAHCCFVCGAPRTENSIVVAGHVFCHHHFRCSTCQTPLDINNFTQRQGRFYCPQHVPVRPALICEKCKREIPSKAIHCMGHYYHSECFRCVVCDASLAGKEYTTTGNGPLCTNCFNKLPKTTKLAVARKNHPK